MQAQAVQTISATESLTCVQTLVKAGVASITYLRNLLPEENFVQARLLSHSNSESFSGAVDDDSPSDKQKRSNGQFKVMNLARGYTAEADKLLDYLENGIFDALRRQYLKSFIFAIYLDPNDPNNLVEAYTFSFTYHTVPGTDTVIPLMSLDRDFGHLSLSKNQDKVDPVTAASKMGRSPTVGEVKKSVKAMVKRIIQTTSQMETLPSRRYATFKLFYYDHVPADYEPPDFRPGDADKDKWFFTTHGQDEVPEKWDLGTLSTPFHGVNISIASIAAHLPSAEDNNAAFAGTTSTSDGPQPALSHTQQRAQTALQQQDATERNVVWDAEDDLGDEDAEGEDDDDYVRREDGTGYDPRRRLAGAGKCSTMDHPEPIGIRNGLGEIEPLEVEIEGISEQVPSHVGKINAPTLDELEQTQRILLTPDRTQVAFSSHQPAVRSPSLPPSDIGEFTQSVHSMATSAGIDTQALLDMVVVAEEDAQMLDMQTQTIPTIVEDAIQSFGSDVDMDQNAANAKPHIEEKMACECHIDIEDPSCLCDGGCNRWYHLWCMGFHSVRDKRIPESFVCFECRARRDPIWEMIKDEAYPKMLLKFQGLALFRRAIKIVEQPKGPDNVAKFAKLLGCDLQSAAPLFKRLESEGFIASQTIVTDALGIMETHVQTTKGKSKKGKQPKQRKNLHKITYSFDVWSKRTSLYADYFNPSPEVESRLLGLSEMLWTFRQHWEAKHTPGHSDGSPQDEGPPSGRIQTQGNSRKGELLPASSPPAPEPQTQDDTQESSSVHSATRLPTTDLKRKQMEAERPTKKVKISVVPALDFQE